MGERLHPEEVPKTLADLETWLKGRLEGLKKDLDFYHNVPGHVDEQACYDAADLVTQAGIFGLSFVPASILEELCPPRKGMSPRDAAFCIRKLLDWCQEQHSVDEATSSNQIGGNSREALEFARNCESDSISTESPKTSPEQTGEVNGPTKVGQGVRRRIKKPPDHYFTAYRLFLVRGITQSELAKELVPFPVHKFRVF